MLFDVSLEAQHQQRPGADQGLYREKFGLGNDYRGACVDDASAAKLSDYIWGMIVQNQARLETFEEARAALELVAEEGITFSSEHAVDRVLSRMKQL